jgi:CBS domain-containing protein
MTTTVRQVLRGKGAAVWTVAPEDTVLAALRVMADKDVGALPVVDGERLVGMVSERDCARKVLLEGRSPSDTRVAEIMTSRVVYVAPERTVEECMALMTDKRVRHLPVLEDERLAGMISIGDVVKARIAEQQFMIDQLESYITR